MNANEMTFDFGKLVSVEGKNRLDVVFFEGEDVKSAFIDGTCLKEVKGVLSALAAIVKGTYPVIEQGLFLRMPLEAFEDEIIVKNAGYADGKQLAKLQKQGLVNRVREVDPIGWYRLSWKVSAFVTEDVVWQQYSAEEADYVSHNRNFLDMKEGFTVIAKAHRKGVNLSLSWFDKNDKYINERMVDFGLRAEGKVEEADKRYAEKVVTSGVKRTYGRVVATNVAAESLGDETIVTIDGEVLSVVDLFGKKAQMVVGHITTPFIWEFNPESAANLAMTAKRQGARFQILAD